MGYVAGIDLGTTFTAAAVARDGGPTMVTLGHRSVAVPSTVFAATDGTLLVGERAESAGLAEPARLASEFKRRFGDTTPLVLGGQPYSPQALMAQLLRAVLGQLEAEEGGPPEHLTLAHPANWGPYKRELLDGVPRLADVRAPVSLLTEPEAAAAWYARQARVPDGATVAVYDLGGGTFDAALLSHHDGRFAIAGRPLGIEHLGGIDIDHTLVTQLLRILGVDFAASATTAEGRQRLARQRAACVEAKEALSVQQQVDITNWMTASPPAVPLSRAEFELLIAPLVDQTVTVLGQAIAEAGLGAEDLHAVLLVGGTSRIPLVAERLGEALDRPVTVDAHPKNAVALGAAAEARERAPQPTPAAVRTSAGPGAAAGAAREPAAAGVLGVAPRPHGGRAGPAGTGRPGHPRRARRPWLALPAAITLLLVVVAVVWARRGDDLQRRTVPGVLSMDVPAGWQLQADDPWDDPADLGPHALQAHPGEGLVGSLDRDDRPFVFIGIPHAGTLTSLEGLLTEQAADWNPGNAICQTYESVTVNPSRNVLRRWVDCTVAAAFLQRAWFEDGVAVYALVRLNDELSETKARKLLDSVHLLAPSG